MITVSRQGNNNQSNYFGVSPASIFICYLSLLFVAPVHGLIETDQLSRQELSVRYRQLIEEYRCPKCQNQNLAGSDSPISVDLRREIRRMLEEGDSDEQISDYLIARYGDFILYRPRFQGGTYLLWLGPVLLLIVGLLVAGLIIRRQGSGVLISDSAGSGPVASGSAGSQKLSHQEQLQLDELLADQDESSEGNGGNTQ
jgi:cytochrome c-type biogenesis protein CcmH